MASRAISPRSQSMSKEREGVSAPRVEARHDVPGASRFTVRPCRPPGCVARLEGISIQEFLPDGWGSGGGRLHGLRTRAWARAATLPKGSTCRVGRRWDNPAARGFGTSISTTAIPTTTTATTTTRFVWFEAECETAGSSAGGVS